MQWKNSGDVPVLPDALYSLYSRVKLLPSGSFAGLTALPVTQAGIEDDFAVLMSIDPFGVTSPYQPIAGRLANTDGTVPMIASGAITAGAFVYPDLLGKITATVQGNPVGVALQAASGNGSIIEVYRFARSPKLNPLIKNLLATSVAEYIFIADRPCKITAITGLIAVAGGSLAACAVRKITAAGTALPGAAAGATVIESLTAALVLTGSAGVPIVGALSVTPTDLILAPGDKIAVNPTGTLTGLVATVSIELQSF